MVRVNNFSLALREKKVKKKKRRREIKGLSLVKLKKCNVNVKH